MTTTNSPTVWPTLHCRDAKGLIKFLVDAFGFTESLVVGDEGVVHHAEVRWPAGGGLMLGDARPHEDELHAQLPTASPCGTRRATSGASAPTRGRRQPRAVPVALDR
jgi:uncharacterized glyoxalase superfamily protein PhnB